MRPAPPRQPRPEGDPSLPTEPSTAIGESVKDDTTAQSGTRLARRQRKRRRNWVGWSILAAAVVILLVWVSVRSTSNPQPGGESGTPSPGVSPTVPGRPTFLFRVEQASSAFTGKRAKAAAADASIEIAARLSTFYDTAFMDPDTWANGVPDDAWSVFDGTVVGQAERDARSLTLDGQSPRLVELEVTTSSLTVKVLLDPSGDPRAAGAEAEFVAVGTLEDGTKVDVTNLASFLLRPEGGVWFVIGYPNATTDVEAAGGSATATPTGRAGPTGSATP
jgi:hypothetical protein